MHFIRIITAATKSNNKTKKLIKKRSITMPKTHKNEPKTSPRSISNVKYNKNIKPSTKNVSRRFKMQKPKGIYPLQDISTPVLQDLLEQGYNMVTFVAYPGACAFCKGINGKTKQLLQHLRSLQHDAPLFEMAHVNSQSELKIWDKNGELPDIFVNYNGETHQ